MKSTSVSISLVGEEINHETLQLIIYKIVLCETIHLERPDVKN